MASMLERLQQKRAEDVRAKSQQISAEQINLRGTGLTKRIAERDAKAYVRETEKALKANEQDTLIKSEAEEQFTRAIKDTIDALKNEHADKITLDESQEEALVGCLTNQFSVMIGAAGTGKTTLENLLITELAKRVPVMDLRSARFVTIEDELGNQQRVRMDQAGTSKADEMPAIACCAYTGRAAQQMKRVLPDIWHKSTSTIHSLLGYAPVFEEYEDWDPITKQNFIKTKRIFRPSFGTHCKLPYKVIFMDESGMTPIPLWNELIDALTPECRIVLIGDINQLPPVYGKSVLGYAMRKWPVFELRHIHRQAAGNAIIKNAHNCLNGRPLENAQSFHIIGTGGKYVAPGGASEMAKFSLQIIKFFAEKKIYDPYRDAIITPWNKSLIGTSALNAHLVQMFNPEREENGVKVNKRQKIHTGNDHRYFALGDKVMITSNINTADPPITNGMIGFVDSLNLNGRYDMKRSQVDLSQDDIDVGEELDIDAESIAFDEVMDEVEKSAKKGDDKEDQRQSSHVMRIKFENGQEYECSTAGDYRRIEFGYAITCHKAQGGEYPNVVILCHSANIKSLSREWLYTAITRARNNVYIIGNARGISQALRQQRIKGNSIAEKIRAYVIETKSDDDFEVMDREKHPVLWPNKRICK